MVVTEKKTLVVDCDTHTWQPIELWEHLIDPRHKDRIVDYMTPKDFTSKDMRKRAAPFYAIKGGDDPVERIKWMDEEGVYANIIFPGAGLVTYLDDPDAVSAACRAVNMASAQFAKHAPDRLRACMILPFRYPDRALEEYEAARGMGLDVVFSPPTPPEEHRWSDPVLDPLWQRLQDDDVVIAFHEFIRPPGGQAVARKTYENSYSMMYFCGHTVEAQLCVMDLICGGTLERFPGLKAGWVEAHVAWLPGWLAYMDSMLPKTESFFTQMTGTGGLSMTPTEFFRRQCFIVGFPDDAWIDENVKYIGEDNVTICTDYPHPQTRYNVIRQFNEHQAHLTPELRRKLLGENAARFFNIKGF